MGYIFLGDRHRHKALVDPSNIFRLVRKKGNLTPEQEMALDMIQQGTGALPFSERWLDSRVDRSEKVLNALVRVGSVYSYPILKESSGGMVAQTEHTLHVNEKGCTILTTY